MFHTVTYLIMLAIIVMLIAVVLHLSKRSDDFEDALDITLDDNARKANNLRLRALELNRIRQMSRDQAAEILVLRRHNRVLRDEIDRVRKHGRGAKATILPSDFVANID